MGTYVNNGFYSGVRHFLWGYVPLFFFLLVLALKVNSEKCDLFTGTWVKDNSYPLYQNATCPFIEPQYGCQGNGRPDQLYTHYRWQPRACNLRRFDGRDFLEKVRGKSIMFVGDSISRDQWQSLTCLLHSAVPNSNYTRTRDKDVAIFTFTEYNVKVMVVRNVYLVDIVQEKIGRVLKLDSVEQGSKVWNGVDMLIFNTWHWWNRNGSARPWDFVQLGNKVLKDIDRLQAFEEGLKTWAKWVDANVNPSKMKVFFQGTPPAHFNGSEWNEPGKSCLGQQTPLPGSTYPAGLPPAVGILKRVLSTIKKPVTLLDITPLSLLRIDGHPSIYGKDGVAGGSDCVHWCLPGVPDTWNQIFYNLIS